MTNEMPGTWSPTNTRDIPPGWRVRRTTVGTWNFVTEGLDHWEFDRHEMFRADPLACPARSVWRDPLDGEVWIRTDAPTGILFVALVLQPGACLMAGDEEDAVVISRLVPA